VIDTRQRHVPRFRQISFSVPNACFSGNVVLPPVVMRQYGTASSGNAVQEREEAEREEMREERLDQETGLRREREEPNQTYPRAHSHDSAFLQLTFLPLRLPTNHSHTTTAFFTRISILTTHLPQFLSYLHLLLLTANCLFSLAFSPSKTYNSKMSRRRITREYAERLLQSFRLTPGNVTAAARHSGVVWSTAKAAWEKGIPHGPWEEYRRPFKDIIAEEQELARARLKEQNRKLAEDALRAEAERQKKQREAALQDVTNNRVQEASMVRLARSSAIVLLNNLTNVSAGAAALGKKVRESLEHTASKERDLTLKETGQITTMIGRLSTALRQATDAAQKAMEMERLLLGEPGKIVGVQHLEGISVREAEERIEAASRAMQALKEDGIDVLDIAMSTPDGITLPDPDANVH
jgi:hypothetical protein